MVGLLFVPLVLLSGSTCFMPMTTSPAFHASRARIPVANLFDDSTKQRKDVDVGKAADEVGGLLNGEEKAAASELKQTPHDEKTVLHSTPHT